MLVRHTSTKTFAAREAGGKGFNLYLMAALGLPVPKWVALGKSVYQEFVSKTRIASTIKGVFHTLAEGKITVAKASLLIEDLIVNAPLPTSVKSLAEEAYDAVAGSGHISVRSSATDEDGTGHSFAGQLSSYLYVASKEDALKYMKTCWASGFSQRSLIYRLENGIPLEGISVSVVFQRMIDPVKSGVMFTCDPMTKDLSKYVISAVYGVGEGLVSGALDADTFWIDSESGTLVSKDLVAKKEALCRSDSGACKKRHVDKSLWNVPSLDDKELGELHRLGKKLQDYYGSPQDVEWAIADGRIYLLQTRPVTTLDKNLTGYPNLWDNSNIVESYGGLTSPLSFTFALQNYKNVYVQFCEILGVSRQVIKDMESYLGNMLGCINGRVYYNLYNWYKLVGVLPGFSKNRQFMETMMGVSEELTREVALRVKPHPSWDSWIGKLRKVRTGLSFLYYHVVIQRMVDQFLKDFSSDYDRFRKVDYGCLRSDQIFEKYLEMDRAMLSKWKAPIINDFLCMVHFGVLKKLTNRWLGDLGSTIQNDLLAGEGNLESAEPTKTLIRMAAEVEKIPGLRRLIEDTPADLLHEKLNQSPYNDFFAKVETYIDRFGFRCMNEMKLEELDLEADPTFLYICLKNYLRSGTTDLEAYEKRERKLREDAESAVKNKLRGLKKKIYLWSLLHARKAVKNRENTRFARTRAYGVGRSMFRAMGRDLCTRGIIEHPNDIFYLELKEIYGIHQGTLASYDLKAFVAIRKKNYETFEGQEPETRFLTRGPVYWQNDFIAGEEIPDVDEGADYQLKGLPCCPGVVEGTVKFVQSPADDLNLDGEILVTKRTDPGWVPLYPSISGLLVERGSLLSHSAIVAREMGLPTIVGIKALTSTLKSGMRIRLDGKKGTITILDQSADTVREAQR